MHGHKRLHEVIHERRIAANITRKPEVVKWHEDAVRAHESKPKMQLAQLFAHHPASHFWKPEIGASKHSKDCRYAHYHVKVSDHEIGGMKIEINRGLRQEKTAHPAADEQGDES